MIKTNIDEKSPWFGEFWPKDVPKQLEYDETKTCYDNLVESTNLYKNEVGIWFLESEMTYGELKEAVDLFANGLFVLGLKKGDVLAIALPNCPQFIIAFYACIKLGVIVTGVNPTYKPGEVLHQLKMTSAKGLVVLDSLNNQLIQPIRNQYKLDFVIATNILDFVKYSPLKKFLAKLLKKAPSGSVPDSYKMLKVLELGKTIEFKDPHINPLEDPVVYIMTGGTTGVPKAAVLTNTNIYSNAQQCITWLENQKESPDAPKIDNNTGIIGVLPLFHSFGMTTVMTSGILGGGRMVLFPIPPKTEELLQVIEDMEMKNGFIYCGAEVLFQRIADLPEETLKNYNIAGKLKLCLAGAGPLHEYVRIPFEEKTGGKITEGYGLSEASPVISAGNFYGEKRCVGTVGLPFPGTDWKIFPADDFEKGPIEGFGEEYTGEICAAGPQVMKEYLNLPEQTADTLKEYNGKVWLLTGDIGYMDEYGRIIIRDRKKQLIKYKGYSVYPKEVETLVGMHPDVIDVAAAGLPDPETNEIIKVWVSVKDGSDLTPESLKAWCKENMTHYKVPKLIEFRNEIPKTLVGKVMRRTLQEEDPIYKKYKKSS